MQLSNKTTPTLKELTEQSSYKNSLVVRHYGNMNMVRALESPNPSVGLLSKKDIEGTKQCITNMFIGTSMYFDKPLNTNQADVIAEEILSKYEFRQMKLEDVLSICIEIKEADIYKLTPARILKHIASYVDRREQAAISRSIKLSEDGKAQLGESNIDQRVKNSIRQIDRSNSEVVKGRLRVRKYYK